MDKTRLAYSIPEFCSAIGVGRTKVYEEIKAGRLRSIKVGARSIIAAEEGRAWLQRLADEQQGGGWPPCTGGAS
jgi:excisionase family DNA binding protein